MGGGYSSSSSATSGAKAATDVTLGNVSFGPQTAASSNTVIYIVGAVVAVVGFFLLRKSL